jgi:competence protein ComEC
MALERLDLFDNRKEIAFFGLFIAFIFAINLFFKYQTYQNLTSSKFNNTKATILNQYQKVSKKGKPYYVLRLKSDDGYKFITTNYEDIRDLKNRSVRVGIITDKISFLDFLKGFYAPTFDIELLEYQDSIREKVATFIKEQHKDKLMGELFSALFLATPISKDLREKISIFGVSHLVAISGYHLGFLYGVLMVVLAFFYKFFQDRYFPYRNRVFDLSIIIISLLFLYAYFLDFTPSILRSFTMMAFGFLLYVRHIKIFSFEVLAVVVLFLIALDPSLCFSVGFWFSVSGIYYIYLFIHHFSDLNRWLILVLINIWVFTLMAPIVHYIFANFSFWQLLSPVLSLAFAIFYPVELLLHIAGVGGIFDGLLLKMFEIDVDFIEIKTPLWFLISYIVLSLLAIFNRWVLALLVLASLVFYLL